MERMMCFMCWIVGEWRVCQTWHYNSCLAGVDTKHNGYVGPRLASPLSSLK